MEEINKILEECLHGDLDNMLNWNRDDIMQRYYAVYDACVGQPDVLAQVANMLIDALDKFSVEYHPEERSTRLEYMSFVFRFVRRRMKEVILQDDPFIQYDFSVRDDETLSQILSRRVFAQV